LDIQPLSRGHALVIPKEHTVKFHELSDESLADILPVAKKVAKALGVSNYNILQNNGTPTHTLFNLIPLLALHCTGSLLLEVFCWVLIGQDVLRIRLLIMFISMYPSRFDGVDGRLFRSQMRSRVLGFRGLQRLLIKLT